MLGKTRGKNLTCMRACVLACVCMHGCVRVYVIIAPADMQLYIHSFIASSNAM